MRMMMIPRMSTFRHHPDQLPTMRTSKSHSSRLICRYLRNLWSIHPFYLRYLPFLFPNRLFGSTPCHMKNASNSWNSCRTDSWSKKEILGFPNFFQALRFWCFHAIVACNKITHVDTPRLQSILSCNTLEMRIP